MSMLKEFKEFAVRGTLVDTAVAFVMGVAFGKIVTAFVDGMVMPLVGMATGGADLSQMKWILKEKATSVVITAGKPVSTEIPEVSVKYGIFLTSVIDFIIVAFVVFLAIKAINRAKRKEQVAPAAEPAPSTTEQILMEIRDSLRK